MKSRTPGAIVYLAHARRPCLRPAQLLRAARVAAGATCGQAGRPRGGAVGRRHTAHPIEDERRLLACDPLVPILAEVEREVEREWTRRAAWLAEDD